MTSEAPFRETTFGLVADVEGWFVLNARESRWRDYGPMGFNCSFEGKRRFPQLGINVNVLPRGASLGLYHVEAHQEDFLVVSGECALVVEGEKRALQAWDFVHCPAGTAHMIVATGDEPAVVIAVGGRGGRTGLRYLVDPVARELGVSVEAEATKPAEAYAGYRRPTRTSYRDGWLPDL